MRMFTEADVQPSSSWDGRISTEPGDLVPAHDTALLRSGRQQTASGYGSKLVTSWKINFCGRLHRVYCCCYSNSGTSYIVSKGRKIIVDAV